MIELQKDTKTLICIGSGGVGKTTLSASIGLGLAFEGKKVLVLTIDPSKRLAQTLGINTHGEVQKVNISSEASGELHASVIDHQKTFDWFIRTAAGSTDVTQLLENSLYQQLSGRLSGSQEFTSLISLFRHVSSKEFDLVILDTPPSQHTWNFLKAPEKIASLFNEGVASWFRQGDRESGFFKKLLNLGTAQVLKALETLTGSLFMKELSAFFTAIQNWQGPLESYVLDCHRLLTSSQTEFLLVTGLDSSRLIEAQKLCREILKQGYNLKHVVINRVPTWVSPLIKKPPQSQRLRDLASYFEALQLEPQTKLKAFKNDLKMYKCYEQLLKRHELERLQRNFESIELLK